MMEREKRRPGRKPQRANQGQRASLGLKVTPDIKNRLDDAAKLNGRTQSQEAEVRIEKSFTIEQLFDGLDGIKLAWTLFSAFRDGVDISYSDCAPKDWLKDAECLKAGLISLVLRLWLQHPNWNDPAQFDEVLEHLHGRNLARLALGLHSTEGRRRGGSMTGHLRQRSPGAWELRYSLGADPATGRRKTATATVRGTRKDAERELRRLLRAVDTGEHVDPNRLTVREWLGQWLAAVKQEVAPRTHERYGEIVRHFLLPALGNLPLAKLAPTQIQTLYTSLAEGGRRDGKPGGLSPQTRRHVHRILSSALSRAVEQQLLARNPCDAFKKRLPKVERQEMAILTVEQAQALLASHSAIPGSTGPC